MQFFQNVHLDRPFPLHLLCKTSGFASEIRKKNTVSNAHKMIPPAPPCFVWQSPCFALGNPKFQNHADKNLK